ncbi:MAG: IMP cyclohydrolase [Candidatus Paceibacterota bacterium]
MKKPFRVLLSVTNKTGLVPFATRLTHIGGTLVSTSGTAKALRDAGLERTLVEHVTGFPEMLNGRVRTLHPNIFGGIIADQSDPEHMETLAAHNIQIFDMVVVNLYLFAAEPSIEQIDVGGPSLIRAAAKNYRSVIVVTDPHDYDLVADFLEDGKPIDPQTRLRLATKAFEMTAAYDQAIARHFTSCVERCIEPAAGHKH